MMQAENAPMDEKYWQQLASADSFQQYVKCWLHLQVAQLGKVEEAVVLFKAVDQQEWAQVASIPEALRQPLQGLSASIKKSVQQGKGVLQKASKSEKKYFIAYPLLVAEDLVGVSGFYVTELEEPSIPVFMRRLQWGALVLENFYQRTHFSNQPIVDQNDATSLQVLKIIAIAVETEKLQDACNLVVNELATQLSIERVYLGRIASKHNFELVAVSHKIELDHRSNLTKSLYAVMDEALNFQGMVLFTQQNKSSLNWPFPAHEELLNTQEQQGICSLPLVSNGQVFGVLVLQSEQEISELKIHTLEAIAVLLAPILQNKALEQRPLRKKISSEIKQKILKILGPENIDFKVLTIGFTSLILIFLFMTMQFKVTADAFLEGSVQRSVVAAVDGYIEKSEVSAGDFVKQGQVLFELDDRDLVLEKQNWLSQRQQYYRQYRDALANKERSQINVLKAQLGQADAQLSLVEEKLRRVVAVSPFEGVIVSGDLSQMLGSPVSKGDVLFEIAPLESYRLIIEVDERDIKQITRKQKGTLVLSSASKELLAFQVDKITPIANSHDGGNFFRVESSLLDVPDFLRPGMKGVAKIEVGPRNIVWIWTHNAFNRLRLWLWRWLP